METIFLISNLMTGKLRFELSGFAALLFQMAVPAGLAALALRLFSACWPRSRTAFSSQHDIFISKGALGGLPPEALA
jgi:hypothetical protein